MTFRLMPLAGLAAIFIGISATFVVAEPATDSATRGVLEEFGFFGQWAIRCDQPASVQNTVRSAYVSAAGEPGFSENLGEGLPENVYRILGVERRDDNQITLAIELNGQTLQRLTMVRDESRIRTITNELADGRIVVKNGIVAASGGRTPWLSRCPQE